ncbi:gamma-parvin isoform X2 [Camelus ferus]|uniref:Gamma-parvin isoform X2 n=1 Tax=Camelus ferus TaxID=419612 RepID=A0A8B7K7C0_CAMFR|nr:gamma-parvin isoform X2 [Camelus ferus]
MEPEALYNLLQLPGKVDPPAVEELSQGEKKKFLPPTSRKDAKFEELQRVLMEWINAELLPEHIVVRSLEEDMFDGLILHHLFQKLAGLKLDVEEIALTAANQRRKLTVVLEAANQSLQVEEQQAQWSVETIFNKDLLATLHLLVALAEHFQPDLPLPANVQVEVITMESTKSGLKSEKLVERLTGCGCLGAVGKTSPRPRREMQKPDSPTAGPRRLPGAGRQGPKRSLAPSALSERLLCAGRGLCLSARSASHWPLSVWTSRMPEVAQPVSSSLHSPRGKGPPGSPGCSAAQSETLTFGRWGHARGLCSERTRVLG